MIKRIIVVLLLLQYILLFSENRTALVIGNQNYNHMSKLSTPRNEAIAMKNALERLNFEVILVLDGSEEKIIDELYNFEEMLKKRGGLALFHYGGHGVQVNDSNYIIPVDANIPDERRVRTNAINLDEVSAVLEMSGSKTNIIILDACRDNPLPSSSRSSSRGLAVVANQPSDSIIIYSADAGTTAKDGLFTPTLLKYIETPGLEIGEILKKVRRDVRKASGGSQRTGEYNQLESDIYLAGSSNNFITKKELNYYDLLNAIKLNQIEIITQSVQLSKDVEVSDFYFNGKNDFIKGKMNSRFPTSNHKRSISIDVKQLSVHEAGNVLFCYGDSKEKSAFGITYNIDKKSGNAYITIFSWAYDKAFWCKDLVNKWVNITVTFDGQLTTVYIDGEKIGESNMSLINTTSNYFVIGSNMKQSWNQFTKTYIRNIKIYDHVISIN